MIHIRIPLGIVRLASEQLPTRIKSIDTAIAFDEAVAPFAGCLLRALKAGASDLYAQTSALWLSTHLLLNAEHNGLWLDAMNKQQLPDARLLRVLEFIKEHLKDDLTLQVLAKEAGLSELHFVTLFRRAMEKSPHRHVLHLRMANAAGLLRDTKMTVAEIAMLCGFKTVSHFCVAFRKSFDRSPTEHRVAQRWIDLTRR